MTLFDNNLYFLKNNVILELEIFIVIIRFVLSISKSIFIINYYKYLKKDINIIILHSKTDMLKKN